MVCAESSVCKRKPLANSNVSRGMITPSPNNDNQYAIRIVLNLAVFN